jgi:hypothetical protein
MAGYRFDDLQDQRWIFGARAYQENEAAVKDIAIEMDW